MLYLNNEYFTETNFTNVLNYIWTRNAIGFEKDQPKKTVNLSQLAKNTRSKIEKKSGRKKARKNFYTLTFVIPAPDSTAVNKNDADDPSRGPTKNKIKTYPLIQLWPSISVQDGTEKDVSLNTSLSPLEEQASVFLKNDWLSDLHVNSAYQLIKKNCPNVWGFQDVVLQQTLKWDPVSDFVQIFHVNVNHWITEARVSSSLDTIQLYDSKLINPTDKILDTIARYARCFKGNISFQVMTVQTQANDYDCGPFALAFAKSLADSCDPTQLNYFNLRQHLYSAFVENKLEQFPSYPCQRRRKLFHKTIKKELYCRAFDTGTQMIACDVCKEWYHTILASLVKKHISGMTLVLQLMSKWINNLHRFNLNVLFTSFLSYF